MRVVPAITMVLIPFVLQASAIGQLSARPQAVPFGDRGRDPDAGVRSQIRAYDLFVARGNDRAAAQAAFSAASIYERREDYVNAETWYRACYVKGQVACSKNFIDLILLKKVTINDPSAIRSFVEARAVCGSRIAREYALSMWHETPAQMPVLQEQTLEACSPVGPTDHMETNLAVAARRAQEQKRLADYYRQHPEQSSEAQERGLAAAAALVLGGLVITAAAMPASGPGSIACNKYQNNYPGAHDASVCDPLTSH